MSDDNNGAFDLDLAVSSLVADSGDTQLMMRLLAERLAPALGSRLQVEREGRLLRKSGALRRLEVRVGDNAFVAELNAMPPTFSIGRISGGVRIRTDQTNTQEWIRLLLQALQQEAEHSAGTRQALESIVIGGT